MTKGQKSHRSAVLRVVLLFAMVAGTLTALTAISTPASAQPAYNVMIKNYATGDCLVRAAKYQRVQVAPCTGDPNERWGMGCSDSLCFYQRIYNLVNDHCLTGVGPETDTQVGLYECWSLGSRDIWLGQASSQGFRFASTFYRNECLEQLNNIATLAPCSLSNSQFWTFVSP